ncbi:hypothetical protein CDD82_2131 [Ophiocordyceps australis]|uniref:1-acyl-sn-glycerol-3-phosphate acyltransferase n=1 Tax=Ophiocordyceps australis TaxID=1399860 RepID=A0A2C5ZFT2_9HYPO|nr:hypothetical protein CDD82_2131 [Ophiocordyceps australis]
MAAMVALLAKSMLAYTGLVVLLYALSAMGVAKAGFLARVLASYLTLAMCTISGALSSVVLALAGHQQIAQWFAGRVFHHAMVRTTGVRFVVDDANHVLDTTRPAVFVGNHQTELDVLMLGAMFPPYCSVTAKSDLRHVPLLGWFMRLSGSIFIDRRSSHDAREAMRGAAQEIKAKRQSVYMFPEGTRSYAKDPMLLPFKKGAFHLAIQAGVPIVPCVVANYSHILYAKDMLFTSGTIPIKVLDPIPTDGLTSADVEDLARKTRDLMLDQLIILSAQAKGQPISTASSPSLPSTKATSTGIDTPASSL